MVERVVINRAGKVNIEITDNDNNADPCSFVGLVGAKKCIEHFVYFIFIEEIICIVERDKQHNLLLYEMAGYRIENLFERSSR